MCFSGMESCKCMSPNANTPSVRWYTEDNEASVLIHMAHSGLKIVAFPTSLSKMNPAVSSGGLPLTQLNCVAAYTNLYINEVKTKICYTMCKHLARLN